MEDGNFRPPQNPHPLTDDQKKLVQVIMSAAPTAVPNLVESVLGKWNEILFYLYLFVMNSPKGQTRRRIFTLGGSNDADSRKDEHFGCFVDIAPHFGLEIPR